MFNDYFTRLLLTECQNMASSKSVDQTILDEVAIVAKFVSSNDNKYIKDSKILQQGIEYLTEEFALALNEIDSEFYSLNAKAREERVTKFWQGESQVDKALTKVLVNYSYQEIVRNIQNLLDEAFGSPFLLVQTPVRLGTEMKEEIMKKIQMQNTKPVIVQFQVNQALIGGIRVFQDGEVIDLSWMGRIEKIVNLNI